MKAFLAKLRQRAWVRRLIAAWQRLSVTNGNLYAAAITYFSFLALFPLVLLAVAIAGFVLASHPEAVHTLFDKITENVGGELGTTLKTVITTAIDKRAGVGVIGLAGVFLSGLGWIGNLRTAMDAVWELPQLKQNPIKQRVVNLGVLGLLGFGILLSLGVTTGWTAFTHELLSAVNLTGVPGMGTLLWALGLLVTLVGDSVIFFLVLTRLPHTHVDRRAAMRGALLAAAGFEILKIVGTYTIASATSSPTAGPFASILAVLIWIQLVVRFLLFCTALTAELTLNPAVDDEPFQQLEGPVEGPADEKPPVSPAAVGAGLVGTGAVAGAALTAYALRRKFRR